ncbi:MAG: hypothetical protein ACK5LF_22815, partial [Bacteroides xylanisolvens]
RLEVMPDAVQIDDPFAKPSLKKEVVTIAWNPWNMKIDLPDLGNDFLLQAIDKDNAFKGQADKGQFVVTPGVYLLKKADVSPVHSWQASSKWNNMTLGEFVAPKAHAHTYSVVHTPQVSLEENKPLCIKARIVGPALPDSVIIYSDKVSFWSDSNPSVKMKRTSGYNYEAEVPVSMISKGSFNYNIIVCAGNKNYTYPANVEGNPLDWDFTGSEYWRTQVVKVGQNIALLEVTDEFSNIDSYAIPETSYAQRYYEADKSGGYTLNFKLMTNNTASRFFLRKYVKEELQPRMEYLDKAKYICLNLGETEGVKQLKVGFVTSDGYTYTQTVALEENKTVYKLLLNEMNQDYTALLPAPFPVFLERYFKPEKEISFDVKKIEFLEVSTANTLTEDASFGLKRIWIE